MGSIKPYCEFCNEPLMLIKEDKDYLVCGSCKIYFDLNDLSGCMFFYRCQGCDIKSFCAQRKIQTKLKVEYMEKIHKIKSWEELGKLLGENEKMEKRSAFAIIGYVYPQGKNPDTIYIAEIDTLDTTPIMHKLNELTSRIGLGGKIE